VRVLCFFAFATFAEFKDFADIRSEVCRGRGGGPRYLDLDREIAIG